VVTAPAKRSLVRELQAGCLGGARREPAGTRGLPGRESALRRCFSARDWRTFHAGRRTRTGAGHADPGQPPPRRRRRYGPPGNSAATGSAGGRATTSRCWSAAPTPAGCCRRISSATWTSWSCATCGRSPVLGHRDALASTRRAAVTHRSAADAHRPRPLRVRYTYKFRPDQRAGRSGGTDPAPSPRQSLGEGHRWPSGSST
jgi:hypothetical protein